MARRRLTPARSEPRSDTWSAPRPAAETALSPAPRAPAGPPIAQVAGQSAEAAALRAVTEGLEAARASGRMVLDLPLESVAPGYLARDRIAPGPTSGPDAAEGAEDAEDTGAEAGLAALKASIRAHGQRMPAEVTPLPAAEGDLRWGLVSGWRRLQALAALHAETGEARFATLRALVRPPEEAAASYVAMVEENEIRLGLSYYERARVVAEAVTRGVFADQSEALRSLFATASRAKRSKIASFIDIHEALGDRLRFPAAIPERLGLALVARLRHGERCALRAALEAAAPADAAAELRLLERLARPARSAPARQDRPARHRETLAPGVAMVVETGRDGAPALTLSGPGVDAALIDRIRQLLG